MVDIKFGNDLTQKIMEGVDLLANSVGNTLGTRGRTVIIKTKNGKPFCTKDGVTVARSIILNDPFQDLGVAIIRQAAESTVKTLMDIENIATISANGDRNIGKLIAMAIDKVGRDGSIAIQESKSNDTIVDVSEGFTFDSGLFANAFINDERRAVCHFDESLVLVTNRNMNNIDDLRNIMELVARDGRPLVIISEQIDNSVLSALTYNAIKGTLKAMAIKAPRYGEERRDILSDIALITGATFVSNDSGIPLRSISLKHLGNAKIAESGRSSTTIVSNNVDQTKLSDRIQSIKQQIMESDNMTINKKLQERITRLASAIAIIKVGGNTEVFY